MKQSRTILGICLAVALVGTSLFSAVALADNTTRGEAEVSESTSQNKTSANSNSSSKEEVVYANLSTEGSVDDIYVVNELKTQSSGTVTDFGNYREVSNLTNTNQLSQEGEAVSVSADSGEFYYQGTLASTDLPWNYALDYRLDGKSISAADLAGKSGKLELKLSSTKNNSVDPSFYDNYMQQISLTLDTALSSNIVSEGASIANSGKNKVITHTVMPEKDAAISIYAEVRDFSMAGFQIAALPFSMAMDMPETDSMLDQMLPLTDAVAQLNDGANQLASGAESLADGASQMRSGSSEFNSGLNQLSSNSASLVDGSAQIQSALLSISSAMGTTDSGLDPTSLTMLPQALNQMSAGLGQMSTGLTQLKDGYSEAYGHLMPAIESIPGTPLDPAQFAELYAKVDLGSPEEAALNELIANYTAAQTVRGVYYGGAADAFAAVVPTIDALTTPGSGQSINDVASGLSTMATQIDAALQTMDIEGLQQLADGLVQLSQNYDSFHTGLVAYTDGVRASATGYTQFDQGLTSLTDGVGQYADGVEEYAQGMGQLNEGVSALPDTMKEEIDKLMSTYDKSDFKQISFVSSKNKNVDLVQFVITTEDVALQDTATPLAEEEEPSNFWDKLLQLFQ